MVVVLRVLHGCRQRPPWDAKMILLWVFRAGWPRPCWEPGTEGQEPGNLVPWLPSPLHSWLTVPGARF